MEAVIFDLDGTLLDTSEGVLESFDYTVKKLNLEAVPQNKVRGMIGIPVHKWFEQFYNLNERDSQYAADIFREYSLYSAVAKAEVYPGVYELLKILASRKIKIAVATNKREDCALGVLEHFEIAKYCNSIHGVDKYNKLKKADVIEKCLAELNVMRNNTVLVGDTVHDAQGAESAGIHFIGATYGIGFKDAEELNYYPHIGVVKNILEVADLL